MMESPFAKKFLGKSPIKKELVGKQNRLPEELKAKILAAPEDSPAKQKVVGENTGKIKKDKKGKYALRLEDSVDGKKGDTIRIPDRMKKSVKDGYIIGGDYGTKKTGKKSFELTDSPLNKHEFGHKETSSAEARQPRFIKNPAYDKLTDKEKKDYQIKAREANKIITYKGVKFDPEDGALVNMPNPNYKK